MVPIALFCFKRIDQLISCIDSLLTCPEASMTDLVIFSDAGRNENEEKKVDEVRSFCENIKGFKSLQINHREENLGVDYNIIQGVQEMADKFESFIIVEDDLLVSNQFLWFMNIALNEYKYFANIITISGFNYVKIPKNYVWDCYFASRTNPWGWATWSNKIKDVDWELAFKGRFLSNHKEMKDFNLWGSDRTRMLKRTIQGKIRAWDIRLDYYQFKRKLLTVYSCKNLVINNGFNIDDATNTFGFNRFKVNFEEFISLNLLLPKFFFPINSRIKRRFIFRNSIFIRILTIILKTFNIKN